MDCDPSIRASGTFGLRLLAGAVVLTFSQFAGMRAVRLDPLARHLVDGVAQIRMAGHELAEVAPLQHQEFAEVDARSHPRFAASR